MARKDFGFRDIGLQGLGVFFGVPGYWGLGVKGLGFRVWGLRVWQALGLDFGGLEF